MPVTPLRTTSPMGAGVSSSAASSSDEVSVSSPAGISMLAVICSTESCTVRVMSSRRFSSMGGSSTVSSSASAASKAASSSAAASSVGASAGASSSVGALSSAGVSGSASGSPSSAGASSGASGTSGAASAASSTGSASLSPAGSAGASSAAAVATASSAGAVSAGGAASGCGAAWGAVSGAAWAGMLSFFLLICTLPKILLVLPHRGKTGGSRGRAVPNEKFIQTRGIADHCGPPWQAPGLPICCRCAAQRSGHGRCPPCLRGSRLRSSGRAGR